jgi:hypothetical protein
VKSRNPSVRLVLTCIDTPSCEVRFEPEGAVATLFEGKPIEVEVRGPGTGIIEVSYLPDGINIVAWSGADTFARDEATGKRIET